MNFNNVLQQNLGGRSVTYWHRKLQYHPILPTADSDEFLPFQRVMFKHTQNGVKVWVEKSQNITAGWVIGLANFETVPYYKNQ